MFTAGYSTEVSVLAPLCVMFLLTIGAWFVLDALTAIFMFSKTISLSLKLVMQMTLGGLTISLRVLFCGVMIAGSMLCFLRGLRILLTRGAGKGGRSVAVSNLFTSIYPQSVTRIVTYKKKEEILVI